jgi:hypothetical protein
MFTVRRSTAAVLFFSFFLLIAASPAFGSATNVYITQSGAPSGNCTSNVQTPSFFNNAANWGSGASQIGPGTTVLLCGTFTSSVKGGNVLTVQGSGASGNPVTILFDTGAQMNSTGWWGSYNADACSTCTGAITVNNANYITIDGGSNGIIQNLLNGTPGNSCAAGTCTQSSGGQGSLGIHLAGDNLVVRNLTIQNIYSNAGTGAGASDTGGVATADIRVDGAATNLQINNNVLNNARAGIWGGFNGSTGPSSCPSAGICIHDNQVSDHAWQMTLNSAGANNVVNVYNNNIGDNSGLPGWLNWQYPTNLYHQDGIFIWGSSNNQVVTAYVYNNYIHGDLGQGSPSGLIYCANNGVNGSGTGCALTAFNNVVVGTGSAAVNDQIIAVKVDVTGVNMGPVKLFNNTFVGGAYSLELYNESGGASFALIAKNNIFYPGNSGTTRWFIHQENGGSPISSITASNNLYFNGSSTAWNLNGSQYGSLSAWQTACKCDASPTAIGNPNLSANYTLQPGSPATGLGANLTQMNINPLDTSYNKIGRAPTGTCTPGVAGCWDAGANQFGEALAPPTNLAAVVH